MCKNCQYCLESCYWHLIEKRFCYDESIALYELPSEKKEFNNNIFENMAFYDSVSVIAGRSVVTIDPLPLKENKPIVQQPRRICWEKDKKITFGDKENSKSDPILNIEPLNKEKTTKDLNNIENIENDIELKRKKLLERRMSKSLYLKLDQPKEIPIIRQQSVPKFFLDTPQEPLYRIPSATLTTPVPNKVNEFNFDLYTVVHIEKQRQLSEKEIPLTASNKDERSSRLSQIKEKIKLKRAKSTLGTISHLPHSHHHM